MIKLVYDNNLEILKMSSAQNVNVGDIFNVYEEIKKSNIFPNNLKILIDSRDVKWDIVINETTKITKIIRNVLNKYATLKEAILINRPDETAIAMLVQHSANFDKYKLEIFYTEKAALRWLKS